MVTLIVYGPKSWDYEGFNTPRLLSHLPSSFTTEGELITLTDTNDLAYAKQMTRYLKIVVAGELFISEPQRLYNACMYMSWRCIKVDACQWDLWLLTHVCVCGVEDSREGWNQNDFHLGMGSCDVVEAHATVYIELQWCWAYT